MQAVLVLVVLKDRAETTAQVVKRTGAPAELWPPIRGDSCGGSALDDAICRALHDRATRGESLTEVESRQLDAWYAQNDSAEEAMLNANRTPIAEFGRADIDGVISRIHEVAERMATLNVENDALRSEIADLYRRLPESLPVRSS